MPGSIMDDDDLLGRQGHRWLRYGIGGAAGVLALLLAFSVGSDAAALLLGPGDQASSDPAPGAPVATPAPRPVPAVPPPAPANDLSVFTVRSVLPIHDPIRFGQYYWQPERGPKSGRLVIGVDLSSRVISVFRDGHEIGAAAILKGYSEKPTPLGVFPILYMDADHVSSIYDDAPMPYTMRLTGDGVSIHGTKVENGYATNGCVGVPTAFAKLVFEAARLGDKVIIVDGKATTLKTPVKL